MRVGSAFTGLGGIDLALKNEGAEIAWQIENDPACNRVLERRFPGVTRYGDIAKVKPKRLAPVDLLCGGFPCQDLSVAGRRAGLAGERSGLFFEFTRLARGRATDWLLLENVPGLCSGCGCPLCGIVAKRMRQHLEREKSANPMARSCECDECAVGRELHKAHSGRNFAIILTALVELGYGIAWRVLDARYCGVPQRRRRVFIVGHLGDAAGAAAVLFEPESCDGDSPPSREAGERVAFAIAAKSRSGSKIGQGWNTNLVGALVGRYAKGTDSDATDALVVAHTLKAAGADGSEDGTGRGTPMVADQQGVRRLTPLECERLQGLPDGWTEGESDSARYRMLGNAVAVPVVQWIARRLIAHAR